MFKVTSLTRVCVMTVWLSCWKQGDSCFVWLFTPHGALVLGSWTAHPRGQVQVTHCPRQMSALCARDSSLNNRWPLATPPRHSAMCGLHCCLWMRWAPWGRTLHPKISLGLCLCLLATRLCKSGHTAANVRHADHRLYLLVSFLCPSWVSVIPTLWNSSPELRFVWLERRYACGDMEMCRYTSHLFQYCQAGGMFLCITSIPSETGACHCCDPMIDRSVATHTRLCSFLGPNHRPQLYLFSSGLIPAQIMSDRLVLEGQSGGSQL